MDKSEKRTTGKRIHLTVCPGGGDHTGCIHTTHVKDGKIVKNERTIYPDGVKGIICRRGVAGARLPYHPDRLKHPLKRVGKRGEGKWERVSWEQALDEIADKIKKVRAEYQPESLAMLPFFNSCLPPAGLQLLLGLRLQHLLQATNPHRGMPIDSNPVFSSYFSFGTAWGMTADPRSLVEGNTQYMIVWGSNPAEMAVRFMKYIEEAKRKGAKLVDIGLISDQTAKKADWWIPVKAGSDGALALAMIDVIINENRYDEEYVTRYTNGPFLVRADNGQFLRERDVLSDGDPQKYMIWDTVVDQPTAVAPKNYGHSGIKPALFGNYRPGDVECKPVFQMLTDLASENTPENVAQITGVSPANIKNLAREYAITKPAAILTAFGLRYKNSGNAYRAIDTLGAITGNIGVMGGGTINGMMTAGGLNAPGLRFNDIPIVFPTEARARSIPLAHAFQCMITGKPSFICKGAFFPVTIEGIYLLKWPIKFI